MSNIESILESIEKLTLLEAAELVKAMEENSDDTNQALKNYRSRSSSRLAKKSRFKKCILAIGTATVALAIATVVAKKNKICLKGDFKNA